MLEHCLVVFFVSMVPIIELRGAIPYGVGFGLPLWLTYCIAIVGNMLPVPLIYFFARRVLVWGSDKPVIGRFFSFCLVKGEHAGQKLQKRRAAACTGRCCCLWASPCRVPAHGQVRWPPACWIWTLRRACWPAWAACCWQALSWAR